jgi:hypothetical protein
MTAEAPSIPFSEPSEKFVLSSLVKDPDLLAAHPLDPEAFHLPAHRAIYRRMVDLGKTDVPILAEDLNDSGRLDDIGGPVILADLLTYAVGPHFDHHLANVLDRHTRRKAAEAGRRIVETATDCGDPAGYFAALGQAGEVAKLTTASGRQTLLQRAYALRYDPGSEPPPDEVCLSIGDVPIGARGNLTVIQGKSKVGKSAVVSSVLGAAYRGTCAVSGDTFGISWTGTDGGAIIHLDTEQSRADWHGLVSRGILRSGLPAGVTRLVSLPLVMFARSERLEILRQSLRFERERLGSIDLVMIDGIADLCASPNDEAESLELVSQIMALAQEFDTPAVCVLHENPGTESAKTRGHLGSELNRKAFANLRIDKDAETAVSTIHGTDMRKRDIPKDQGFCFAWDDAAGMHTFQGRAARVKAARKGSATIAKETDYFREIFDPSGTNTTCPALTPDEAINARRDNCGTGNVPLRDAMKKRMQRAESIGVLRKASITTWTFNLSGTSGT